MIYIIIALIFYTAAVLLSTAAARHINSNVAAAIVNTVSTIIPVAVIIPMIAKKTVQTNTFGVWMAVLAGVAIAIYALAFTKSIALNKVGIVTPILYGGTILFTTVLSYFIFKERLSGVEIIGLLMILAGLIIIIAARSVQ